MCDERVGLGQPRKSYADQLLAYYRRAKFNRNRRVCTKRSMDVSEASEICKGLGSHGLTADSSGALISLHVAMKNELQRHVEVYKQALHKLEELSPVTINQDPASSSHQRLLALSHGDVERRLIDNKSLLTIVDKPALRQLQTLVESLAARVDNDKSVLTCVGQIKRSDPTLDLSDTRKCDLRRYQNRVVIRDAPKAAPCAASAAVAINAIFSPSIRSAVLFEEARCVLAFRMLPSAVGDGSRCDSGHKRERHRSGEQNQHRNRERGRDRESSSLNIELRTAEWTSEGSLQIERFRAPERGGGLAVCGALVLSDRHRQCSGNVRLRCSDQLSEARG
ncbi:hypothetical protein EVAR_19818_1 [Eumeta japonica]|uniref:Uncharacterized protein n=1 Tax=Eumeta variegata TaxID=151549 RepID=A0A4C1US19_EUMVA|nr:hypothetical protein EVAR_19818_1 [Eumeta japonica]